MKIVLIVRNPITRLVSDIVHEFLVGSLKNEEMPDIDDMILQRTDAGINQKISGQFINTGHTRLNWQGPS